MADGNLGKLSTDESDPAAASDELFATLRDGKPPLDRMEALRDRVHAAASLHDDDTGTHKLETIGKFNALLLLGQGGFGMVFKGIDPMLGRPVAVKVCRVRDGQDPDKVLNEARMLASLQHENVITVYEAGLHGQDVFFAMEYATGKTAHDFTYEASTWQQIVDVYLAAGAGLAAAHAKRIVHGDFKPLNVLLDEGGTRPRVADFGLARVCFEQTPEDEREAVWTRAGTLGFIAPEVLAGGKATALSDQWSFCASVWATLEKTLPFNAKSTNRMLAKIKRTEPRWINPSVPEAVRDVLRRGLQEDPSQRWANMKELLAALEHARRTAVTPPPVSPVEELMLAVRPAQRRNGPGWRGFVLAGLVAGGVVSLAGQWRSSASTSRASMSVRPVLFVRDASTESVSACPVTRMEAGLVIPPEVEAVCHLIRVGQLDYAITAWEAEYDAELKDAQGTTDDDGRELSEAERKVERDAAETDGRELSKAERQAERDAAETLLAKHTLIVARSFVGEAETLLWKGEYKLAGKASEEAEAWSTWPASILGDEDAGVRLVRFRRAAVEALLQFQHSTTPLPSM